MAFSYYVDRRRRNRNKNCHIWLTNDAHRRPDAVEEGNRNVERIRFDT